ncbi:MAG: hypothetical protein JWR40_1503 [Massilia sp.]|jgi:hypothetical protein|nr:hypothetical protein [Massilia sp.]MDB5953072.1 hypothetical protein [Massilia sp.]
MSSISQNAPATYTSASPTLMSIIAAFFMVNLREQLDSETSGDKSNAAYAYGL